jgi:hypothetical protein
VRSGSQSSATFGKDTQESTMSEGTVETLVTMSPSELHLDPSCKCLPQTHLCRYMWLCTLKCLCYYVNQTSDGQELS